MSAAVTPSSSSRRDAADSPLEMDRSESDCSTTGLIPSPPAVTTPAAHLPATAMPIAVASHPLQSTSSNLASPSSPSAAEAPAVPATASAPNGNGPSSSGVAGGAASNLDLGGGNTPANARQAGQRQVRRNFYTRFSEISRASKVLLLIQVVFVMLQISACFVIIGLSLGQGETCEVPLQTFIIMEGVRMLIGLPLTVYNYVVRPPRTEDPANPPVETLPERLKSILDLLSILWFVFGNWWLFSAVPCRATAPMLYYLSLTIILMGYLVLMFPVILVLCIIFCLPCVLWVLRTFARVTGIPLNTNVANGGLGIARNRGLTVEVLSRIPAVSFTKGMFLEEDAHCTICLGDYVEGEQVKVMPTCRHHFHASCTDEWLQINRTCPLCLRDVREELDRVQEQPSQ